MNFHFSAQFLGSSNLVDLAKPELDQKEITDDDICSVCKLIAEDIFAIDTEQLNYLSGFIFARIKNWVRFFDLPKFSKIHSFFVVFSYQLIFVMALLLHPLNRGL